MKTTSSDTRKEQVCLLERLFYNFSPEVHMFNDSYEKRVGGRAEDVPMVTGV
jgi:hypothetical protein